ncbi:MAG TPA: pantoate--beta-alanine ligase [Lacibacter sp.]|nr:pantoate--beta-alanine ligase [Lacibacter sp.]HMO89801.1 pantoate--beta-alanine ligase [Lacibacter sp.]HMP86472.1 pantoate--beta-alanine ligase [Lacibacter sp.]
MLIFHHIHDLQRYLYRQRRSGQQVGFVPTMGALHAGHLSLLQAARRECNLVVVSIFVNPTQFNDRSDYELYPRTTGADMGLLLQQDCDVLFLPTEEEIYPPGQPPTPAYLLGHLETLLEGAFRPGHFQGVCQVVDRLLVAVEPHFLYLGQKDYQQCRVIQQLLVLTNRPPGMLQIRDTVREADGLAMSSRNQRLNAEERQRAPGIYHALLYLQRHLLPGSLAALKQQAVANLSSQGFRVEYVEVADAETLEIRNEWDGHQKLVALIAAFNGPVRLIDNLILTK